MSILNQHIPNQISQSTLFSNNFMSLSLVLSVQPWLIELAKAINQNSAFNHQKPDFEKQEETSIDPKEILKILGYCSCDPNPQPLLETVTTLNKLCEKDLSDDQKNSNTHDSPTHSI